MMNTYTMDYDKELKKFIKTCEFEDKSYEGYCYYWMVQSHFLAVGYQNNQMTNCLQIFISW